MDTGLYFGIRFFEGHPGEPELTDNKEECKDYIHNEYVNTSSSLNKLIPFGFKLEGTNLGVQIHTVDLRLVVDDENEISLGTNPADWHWEEYSGDTYIFYRANGLIYADEDVACGRYYLKIAFLAGGLREFYSDRFIIPKSIEASIIPNYSISFSVIGGNGTISAKVAGVNILSGSSRWEWSEIVFVASPNPGYLVKEWKLNGSVVGWATTNEYNVILNENIVVSVEFKPVVYSEEYSEEYLKP
jgi:hypothetical protein